MRSGRLRCRPLRPRWWGPPHASPHGTADTHRAAHCRARSRRRRKSTPLPIRTPNTPALVRARADLVTDLPVLDRLGVRMAMRGSQSCPLADGSPIHSISIDADHLGVIDGAVEERYEGGGLLRSVVEVDGPHSSHARCGEKADVVRRPGSQQVLATGAVAVLAREPVIGTAPTSSRHPYERRAEVAGFAAEIGRRRACRSRSMLERSSQAVTD